MTQPWKNNLMNYAGQGRRGSEGRKLSVRKNLSTKRYSSNMTVDKPINSNRLPLLKSPDININNSKF